METKQPWKSKTIMFSMVTIIVALMNIAGISMPGEKPVAEMTWRELERSQGGRTPQITDLLLLLGGGGAVYGRYVAKDKIGGKDNE